MYKFIIWGTGSVAKGVVTKHYNGFFRHNVIIAFVDNAYREKQETFFNIPIISPKEIVHYDMDYILIASSFDEEITKQIVNELYYDENQILHMYDLYHFMYDYWENNLNLSQKKILCIGDQHLYEKRKSYYMRYFNIIGCVDINTLDNICDFDHDYDYILPLTRNIDEINELLQLNFNIPPEQILCPSIFETYRDTDIKMPPYLHMVGTQIKNFL